MTLKPNTVNTPFDGKVVNFIVRSPLIVSLSLTCDLKSIMPIRSINVVNVATNGLQLNAGGTGAIYNAASSNGTLPQQTVGHIFMFALDMENKKMWFGSNGTWYNSGNPSAGSNETWGSSEFVADDVWVPYAQGYQVSSDTTFNFNFGNGTFEGVNVASAGTNASENGIFEYDVPTGFTALSTKGLNL